MHRPSRPTGSELAIYVVCVAIVVVFGVRALRADTGGTGTVDVRGRGATATQTTKQAAAGNNGNGAEVGVGAMPPQALVVHVVGAVRRPGVYKLREGDRVKDAVGRAGGATDSADLSTLNLALRIADGQQVVVPQLAAACRDSCAGTAGAARQATGGAASTSRVSIAAATAEQLASLDGVGPVTARKIIEHRDQNGGLRAVDDLAEVPGIGPKRLAALKELVSP